MFSYSRFSRLSAVVVATSVFAVGCAVDSDSDAELGAPESTVSSTPAVSKSLSGFTASVDLYLHPEERSGKDVWVMHGRTSKTLTSALAFDASGDVGQTTLVSARVFEVAFDSATMESLSEGTRIFVRLNVEGQTKPTYATMMFEPRLRHLTGSSKIYALEEFRAVLIGSDVVFRGTVGIGTGVTKLAVSGPLGAAESLVKESASEYSFDFAPSPLLESARAASPIMKFTGKAAGAAIEKDGTLSVDVFGLELTQGNPLTTFPDPPCDEAVEQCLQALPAGQEDTGSCGTAKEVRTCRASFGD